MKKAGKNITRRGLRLSSVLTFWTDAVPLLQKDQVRKFD